MHAGVPGRWQWRIEMEAPERMDFSLHTAGEDQRWLTDGETATSVLGSTVITREPLASSEMLSIVRFLAVVELDALRDSARFRVVEQPPEEPGDPTRRLAVSTVREPLAQYRLLFDDDLLLVSAEGPLSIPAIGGGQVRVRFSDFRAVDGRRLAFRADYTVDGAPLLEEHVVSQRAF